jgi:hypothetical protein
MEAKMKKLIAVLSIILSFAVLYVVAEPKANYFKNRYVGVVMTYIAGLGTNSVVEFDYTSDVPCRLSEVSAVTNGVEAQVSVNRIWVYHRENWKTEITTNFGYVVTNKYMAGYIAEEVTNALYNSSTDTLPASSYFQKGDVVQVVVGGTGAIVRVTGTAQ